MSNYLKYKALILDPPKTVQTPIIDNNQDGWMDGWMNGWIEINNRQLDCKQKNVDENVIVT